MTKGAIILETRDLDLKRIIDSHFRFMDPSWGLTFYGSKENYPRFQKEVLPAYPFAGFVEFTPSGFDLETYNRILSCPEFWEGVEFEKVLVFQHDSCLLREGIERFLSWDYIGAPWEWNKHFAGNGGLSIRSTDTMIYIARRYKRPHGLNEDHYFTMFMHKFDIGKLAPIKVARTFSVEQIFYSNPIGQHASWKYLSSEQLKTLFRNHPDDLPVRK